MYVPEHFSETRTDVIRDIIERRSLGTRVSAALGDHVEVGWPMGLEPTTTGITILDSTN